MEGNTNTNYQNYKNWLKTKSGLSVQMNKNEEEINRYRRNNGKSILTKIYLLNIKKLIQKAI